MGKMSDLDIALQALRKVPQAELLDLAGPAGLRRPSGDDSPGARFLSDLRDSLADKIEKDACAPDPELPLWTPGSWDLIPGDREAWDIFLDLEVYNTAHANRHNLTTNGARAALESVAADYWREALLEYVPPRFYA